MTVLVLRALGLGDFLTAVPALRGLRLAFPDDRLVLAAPALLEGLARLSGTVDDMVSSQPLGPVDWAGPDLAVNLHGRGPESHRVLLDTRPGSLVAFRNSPAWPSAAAPTWSEDEPERERWCRLLAEHGISADSRDLELPPPARPGPLEARGGVLIHPGGGSVARRWPVRSWAQVAATLDLEGYRVSVSAGPGEDALASQVGCRIWTGGDLLDLAALVACSRLVLTGDTGVAHLATALRRPSVVLFGPTSPAVWGPPPERPWHRVLWRGRTGDAHGQEHHADLVAIRPPEVLAAARDLLETAEPPP
jgi:ADP-heptose:LPS heptosyltransferase